MSNEELNTRVEEMTPLPRAKAPGILEGGINEEIVRTFYDLMLEKIKLINAGLRGKGDKIMQVRELSRAISQLKDTKYLEFYQARSQFENAEDRALIDGNFNKFKLR